MGAQGVQGAQGSFAASSKAALSIALAHWVVESYANAPEPERGEPERPVEEEPTPSR